MFMHQCYPVFLSGISHCECVLLLHLVVISHTHKSHIETYDNKCFCIVVVVFCINMQYVYIIIILVEFCRQCKF